MGISVFSSFSLVLLFLLSLEVGESRAAQSRYNNGVYIVYMGAASSTNGSLRDDHAKLLSSLFRRYFKMTMLFLFSLSNLIN